MVVADFADAIRNARVALSGPLDGAILRLKEASRLAAQIKNPHAHELAYLVGALKPAFETLKLVERSFRSSEPTSRRLRVCSWRFQPNLHCEK